MLLAESDVNNGITLLACLMAAISGLFSWLAGRENRLAARDKMEFDAERVKMLSDIARLASEHKDCEERHDSLQQQVASQGMEIGDLRRRLDDRSNPGTEGLPPGLKLDDD